MVYHSDSPYTSNPADDFLLRPNNQPVKSIVSKTNEKYSKGLDITHQAIERFQVSVYCSCVPQSLQKALRTGRDLTDLREGEEKVSPIAISLRQRSPRVLAEQKCLEQEAALRDYTILHGGLARRHETEALLRGGSTEQAREDVRRFGERSRNKRRYRIPYLRASAVLAQWDNELDQAIAHLEAARDLAEQLGLPGELWQILAALGELYQACKNESQARQAFARAAQVVQSLAGRMEDEQHRTTFLSVQQVRTLLAHAATERGREMTR